MSHNLRQDGEDGETVRGLSSIGSPRSKSINECALFAGVADHALIWCLEDSEGWIGVVKNRLALYPLRKRKVHDHGIHNYIMSAR